MNSTLVCKSKSIVPSGVEGANKLVMPLLDDRKVSLSFNIEDCKRTNLNVLEEDAIDQVLNRSLGFVKEGTLAEKREILLETNKPYTLNSYMDNLNSIDKIYLTNLLQSLNCMTGLEFDIVDKFDYINIPSKYKISACSTINHTLKKTLNQVARIFLSLEDQPTECLILIDDAIGDGEAFSQDRQNSLGHELLHCLGLNHPSYPSLRYNLRHRSIMEDISPIAEKCAATTPTQDKLFACRKAPTNPTSEDVCKLIELYGSSRNDSAVCDAIREDFANQFSNVILETPGSINIIQPDL